MLSLWLVEVQIQRDSFSTPAATINKGKVAGMSQSIIFMADLSKQEKHSLSNNINDDSVLFIYIYIKKMLWEHRLYTYTENKARQDIIKQI